MKKDDGNSIKWVFLVLGVFCIALIMVISYRLSGADAKAHIEDRLGSDTPNESATNNVTSNDSYSQEQPKSAESSKVENKQNKAPKIEAPYVGMSESMIMDTSLWSLKHSKHVAARKVNDSLEPVTMYTFYENGSIVFIAECIDGQVSEVHDYRDEVHASQDEAHTQKKHEPYYPEVDEYTSPEDFYYNFRDYFMDYDEAEQYYYEHGGE